MSIHLTASRRHWGILIGLGVALALALVLVNAHYFFHAQLFEQGDQASNSLTVRQAKEFKAIYGQYSRWGFHHPGPAFFYCYAAGEALFYDALKVVPTPFNGQLLACVALMSAFFALAVRTAARWVQSPWFVPVTLLVALLGFGTVGALAFLSTWPPCVMIAPFLCLLVAAASVGAGRGEDLPPLALASSFMVHSHVAQPLFVLPLFTAAYVGLCVTCRPVRRAGAVRPGVWPWRAFPRAHALAVAIVALFVLPICLDLSQGEDSNFSLILQHMHRYHGQRHPWLDAAFYFLQFAVMTPAAPGEDFYPGGATWETVLPFLRAHLAGLSLWLAVLAVALWVVVRPWQRRAPVHAGDGTPGPGEPARLAHARFLAWLAGCLGLSVILTLVWGRVQDGEMFYFNSFFNYAIYFALAMIPAAALASALDRLVRPARWRRLGVAALYAGVAGVFLLHGRQFAVNDFDTDECRMLARSVQAALSADGSAPGTTKFLAFEHESWPVTVAVALQLERLGHPFRVDNRTHVEFGQRSKVDPTGMATSGERVGVWRIRPLREDGPANRLPLSGQYGIDLLGPQVNPAEAPHILFAHDHLEYKDYTLSGWDDPMKKSPHIWSDEKSAVMTFRAVPVEATAQVELLLDVAPFTVPGRCDSQRMDLVLNGVPLGTCRLEKEQWVRAVFPAEIWNRRAEALLVCGFPDAVSLFSLRLTTDPAPRAFAVSEIVFSKVAAP